ncbi:MAG: hypothetical protein WC136_00300 [Sphaerochaeta sp.]|jgi:hypothetical protein
MVFLINGKKRSGKDTISDIVVQYDPTITKVAFAKLLKHSASIISGISVHELDNLKNDESSFTMNKSNFYKNFEQAIHEIKNIYLLNFDNITLAEHDPLSFFEYLLNDNMLVIDARHFLQKVGEAFKIIFNDPYIWAKLCSAELDKNKDYIISDFRFPVEFEEISKNHKTCTVKVLGKNMNDVDKYDTHSSETALNDFKFDYIINNTIWSSESLNAQITALLCETKDLK